jgi:hypothetical protein
VLRLVPACTALFALSTAFPLLASVLPGERPPRWLGLADVAVAVLLVAVALTLHARYASRVTQADRAAAFEALRRVAFAVPALLALFLLYGDRVKWSVLVVGLLWRGWLFLQVLPALVAASTTGRTRI